MSAIDEVKQRTDIVEVVSQYASLKKAGRNLTALCPFHSEKHPSFFVYPEQQSWHCFGACSTGGDVFSFVMRKEGIDFGEALRLLAQRAGVTLPSRTEREGEKEEREELYRINEAAALYFNNLLLNSPAAEKARSYVTSREFSPQTITDFQLGFSLDSWEALKQYLREKGHSEGTLLTAGLLIEAENGKTHDRFRGKLMFPIRDIKGRTIGFGARALDDSLPKYTNSPQTPTFDKSSNLYGIDLAAASIRRQDAAIIMEGYMDVITAHQNGVTNVVASMGTAVTETQVNILKRLSKNLMLALDADAAGEEAMLRGVGYENTLDAEVRVILLPKGKDPDDVIKEDVNIWQDLAARAVPIVDYTFNIVTSKLDLTTVKNQSLAVEKLGPIVIEIKDQVRKAHYIQELARLTKKDKRTIEAALSLIKPPPVRRRMPEPEPRAVTRALRQLVSSPLEADCLALLLQHPELEISREDLPPEYFINSENHEIFVNWQQVNDLSLLRERLDASLHEHLDSLMNKCLPSNNVEQRYIDYTRRLRERFLKNRAAKISEMLVLEAESENSDTDRTRLEEEGLEISVQLRDVDAHRNRKRPEMRR